MKNYYLALFLLSLLASCAPVRYVRPVEKNTHVVSASFGGPLIGFGGAVLPIPFTSVGYGYGITNQLTGYAHLHTTSLMFGNIQTDFGLCGRIWTSADSRLQVTGNASFNFAMQLQNAEARLWPQADLNLSYNLGKSNNFIYAGAGSWIELSNTRAHNQPQPNRVLMYPQIGFQICKTKWDYSFELKGLQLGTPNLPNVVDYKGIGGNGAIGFYFGISRRFGVTASSITSPR
jgi:hypothetical protein